MKRRDFLVTSAGLIGATQLADRTASASTITSSMDPKSSLKKAIKLQMVKADLSLVEKFKLLKEIGYDGVELGSPNDLDRKEVLRAQEESGLLVHGVVDSAHWRKRLSDPDPGVRAEGVEALKTALIDANAYGATTVLLVPAVVTEDVTYEEAWHRSQAGIREVLPVAKEQDIKIALENVPNQFLLSPLEFTQYIDEFESPYVGAYFDIGNALNYGWPEQWIRILGPRIFKLDVKDRLRSKRDERGNSKRVELGKGSCNWQAVGEALRDIGYDSWGTAEVDGGDRMRLREILQRMNKYLW